MFSGNLPQKCAGPPLRFVSGGAKRPIQPAHYPGLMIINSRQPRVLTGPIAIKPPHDLLLPLNLCNKFLLARKIQFIPGCKELAAVIEN